MARKRGNPDQYLKQIGRSWYVSVTIPRTLQKELRNTHIRRALHTRDLSEANRSKHAVVAAIKAELARMRGAKARGDAIEDNYSIASAAAVRESLRKSEREGNEQEIEATTSYLSDLASSLEQLKGPEAAVRYYRLATATGGTLKELVDVWLSERTFTESTKFTYRKALRDLLEFRRNEDALPSEITRLAARRFIDEPGGLKARGLSRRTMSRKVIALALFWDWMESKDLAPAGQNPWRKHRFDTGPENQHRPEKRPYESGELVKLLKGNETVARWPTYAYLPDLIVLALYSGARIEELCSATTANIEAGRGYFALRITKAKTKSGRRIIAFTSPAARTVLKRRLKAASEGGLLFPELKRGGLDSKFSQSAVKAYTRYRRECLGNDDTVDFHSFRRTLITQLENAGVRHPAIARFVGHRVGIMAADTYSGGSNLQSTIATARRIIYDSSVEKAALACSMNRPQD